ncbi:hypothetical protein JI749_12230 [Devosia oryziradicis]|uniref:Response regulatory domain-containing protein n=1 Tax=Devosia oryziradicis TaxID=2801335 RepID=A0ABX7BT92_9HYPH|nr:hypothetical protein [Devosia oryziradicis]QQR35137.1 hypothetical protein JI749_12230 [Devosia oryziradicis]
MREGGGETGLLGGCAAVIVAHDEADSAALQAIARHVGFGSVSTVAEGPHGDDPEHSLTFFLVHFGLGIAGKTMLLSRLRGHPSDNVRFAPIVLFIPDGPGAEVLFYIEMGFDDVICLPENSHIVASRLATQIGQEHLYIETKTYLGPDRRRMELPGASHPDRKGEYEHTKLFIVRKPGIGTSVVRRQIFLKAIN